MQNWLINRSIIDGNHAVYFPQAYGHEAGFHYFQTAGLLLLGDNALALRLPAAFLGILSVAVTYRFCRALGQRRWSALIGMAVVGTTFFPVFYSRLGLRAISLPMVAGLAGVLFLYATRQNERKGRVNAAKTRRFFLLSPLLSSSSSSCLHIDVNDVKGKAQKRAQREKEETLLTYGFQLCMLYDRVSYLQI